MLMVCIDHGSSASSSCDSLNVKVTGAGTSGTGTGSSSMMSSSTYSSSTIDAATGAALRSRPDQNYAASSYSTGLL